MDPAADLKTICKAYTEAMKRIEALSSSLIETFLIFIRRSAFLLINCSSIRYLFKRLQAAGDDAMQKAIGELESGASETASARNARLLLDTAAKHCPALFVPYIPELAKTLLEEMDDTLLEAALRAMSALAIQQPDVLQGDSTVLDRAYQLSLEGTPMQAKFAATIVVKTPDNDDQAEELVQVSGLNR